MAELHKNQVAWAAPEPAQVQLAKKQDYLSDEISSLGNAMERFAEIKADIDDTAASADMDQVAREAAVELSRYEPDDNNYEPAKKVFYDKINGALDSLSADVRKRFMRDNPQFLARQELNLNEIIFEKQQKFTQNKITLTIPKISSKVLAGEISYEQGRALVENMVKDTNNVFADNALYDFDHDVTKTSLTNMLIKGRYSDVISYASRVTAEDGDGKTGVIVDTLTPEERLYFIKTARQMAAAEAEEKEKLLSSVSGGTSEGAKAALLDAGYATIDLGGSETAEFLHALDDSKSTIKVKGVDGVEYSMGDIDPSIRREVRTAIANKAEESRIWREKAASATLQVNDILSSYKQSTIDDTITSQQNYVQLSEIRNSHLYEYLPSETKKDLDEIVLGQDLRFLNHLKMNDPTVNYTGMFSLDELYSSTVQGGAIGATIGAGAGATVGALGGPLGVGAGAVGGSNLGSIVGGAAGFVSGLIPTKEFSGLSGLKALEMSMYPTTPTEMSPIHRAGDRVTENLSDPQRLYRQATTYARDNLFVGEKEIKYGTAAEFVLNTATKLLALNAFGNDGRSYLGLNNVSEIDIAKTANLMLGHLQRSGEYGLILQEIKDKDQAAQYTKSLFDTFLYYVSKGTQDTESESAIKARDFVYKELVSATKGAGGSAFSFTPTEMSVVDEEGYYPYANEEAYKNKLKEQLKKESKGN